MTKPLLEAKNVTKRFGGLVAVNKAEMSIEKGRITGLIGPNGAGKTTFFNLLSGFMQPDEGEIVFNGHRINGMRPSNICKLGMTRTFQIVKPFPELTVLENVMIGAFNKTGSTQRAKEIALDVLELVEFSDQARMSAGALPVAGRKRVEVAKALATKPELLLLDEVLAGLTPTEMQKMIAVLGKVRDAGITIVIVEHVMAVIMSLCDHIVVINNGENIASGNPQEISVNPAVMEAYLGSDFNAQSVIS
ncbi:MAG: ABC transporter ATP-binding protein [bacterium]|jgi:branched-chain amino acid transport system ATP-binding protein